LLIAFGRNGVTVGAALRGRPSLLSESTALRRFRGIA
jgi:hypothetical protein